MPSHNLRRRAHPLTVERCEVVLQEAYRMLDRFDRLRILLEVVEDLTDNQRFQSKKSSEAFIERQLLYYTVLALVECLELAGKTIEKQHAELGGGSDVV